MRAHTVAHVPQTIDPGHQWRTATRRRAGRTLNWTFEVAPKEEPAPAQEVDLTMDTPSAAPAPLDPPREDEGPAGPFA